MLKKFNAGYITIIGVPLFTPRKTSLGNITSSSCNVIYPCIVPAHNIIHKPFPRVVLCLLLGLLYPCLLASIWTKT